MEETPPPKRTRWLWAAAWTAGSVLALAALAVASWPRLLEGTARGKAVSALERRFDVVEFGCFELGRDQFHICDIHLEKESVVVDLEALDVDFDIRWLARQVVIDQVFASGGSLAGELDDIRELRSADGSREKKAGSSVVELEDAELELRGLEADVKHEGFQMRTTASARASSPAGPFDIELEAFEVLEDGQRLAGAGSVITDVDLEAPFPAKVELEDASASLEDLVIKDVFGVVYLEDDALEVVEADLHGRTGSGQSWTLQGELDRAKETVDVIVVAEGIKPSQLPGADRVPLDPASGSVSGKLGIKGSRKKLELEGELRLKEVRVTHPKLASQPVVVNNLLEFAGQVDLQQRKLVLEKASISPLEEDPRWSLLLSGRLLYAEDPRARELELELELPTADCQLLLESAPPGLFPALEGFELSGVTYAFLELSVKMNDPDATVLEGGLSLDACKLEKVPKTVASLSGPFSHVVKMRTGRTVTRLLGRGALYYTPYDRMPKHLPAAVLSTEDGGFWGHDGFLESQFRASLRRNVELGEFRRGASTITMQMVKNVLLTQEKTVSRKLQELFLTWVVEEQLSKQRIMEVYLNVVEFGPGIYGIGDAADHYFGKTPLELTSLESAFLATLLPRPVERHEMWCRGELTERHAKRIHVVHRRMLKTGRIGQTEFDAALAIPFEFSRRGWPGEAACIADGRRVEKGTHTQGALSGLLLGRPD